MNQEEINQLRADREAARRRNPEYGLTKRCSGCKKELPLNKFPKHAPWDGNTTKKYDRQDYCKKCFKYQKRRRSKGKCNQKSALTLYKIMKEKGITQIDNSNKEILELYVERSGVTRTNYNNNAILYLLSKTNKGKKLFDYLPYTDGVKRKCKYYMKIKENIEDSKK